MAFDIAPPTGASPRPSFDASTGADGDEFEHVWWDLNPGDALVWFHRTLHGAPANTLAQVRRAIAYIWVGDDACYDASPGYTDPDFVDLTLADGDRFCSDRFPKVRG